MTYGPMSRVASRRAFLESESPLQLLGFPFPTHEIVVLVDSLRLKISFHFHISCYAVLQNERQLSYTDKLQE